MIPERYWHVTGTVDAEKLGELVAITKQHKTSLLLLTLDVTGEVPVVTIGDGTYDAKSVEVEFYTGAE